MAPTRWPAADSQASILFDGRRPDVEHGALAFLIGLRPAHGDPAGSVRIPFNIGAIERGDFGDAEHGIGCDGEDCRIAKAGDVPATIGRDRGGCIRLAPSDPGDLTAPAARALAPSAGDLNTALSAIVCLRIGSKAVS